MVQSYSSNHLRVELHEFKAAMRVFANSRLKLGPVLMAYEGGFLSFESGEVTAVMHAEGVWNGRVTFKPSIVQVLAIVPPEWDPVPISYAEGRLLIGSMTIPCSWDLVSHEFIQNLQNPGLVDLLAMARTIPRADLKSTKLGRSITSAVAQAEKTVKVAAKQLSKLEIEESDILELLEARIAKRLKE
jgi:hypothetical protein